MTRVYPQWGFPGGSAGKEFSCNAGDLGLIPGLGRSLEKGKATHSSILACIVHGSQRVRHDWVTFTFTYPQWLHLLMMGASWPSPCLQHLPGAGVNKGTSMCPQVTTLRTWALPSTQLCASNLLWNLEMLLKYRTRMSGRRHFFFPPLKKNLLEYNHFTILC